MEIQRLSKGSFMKEIVTQAILDGLEQQIVGAFQASIATLNDFEGKIETTKKINLLVKLKLLQDMAQSLSDGNHEKYFSDVQNINSKMSERYDEILETMYDTPLDDHYGSFNNLWGNILCERSFLKSDHDYFQPAKLTAYSIWRTLCQFCEYEEPYNSKEYILETRDETSVFPEVTCHNTRLDALLTAFQYRNFPFTPLSWKNSYIPADFSVEPYDPFYDIPERLAFPVRWWREDTYLHTLFEESEALLSVKLSRITEIITSNWVRTEIAEALAYLSWNTLRLMPISVQVNALSNKQTFSSESLERVFSDPFTIDIVDGIDKFTMKKKLEQNTAQTPAKTNLWEELALKNNLMTHAPDQPGVYIIGVKSAKEFQRLLRKALTTYFMREHRKTQEEASDMIFAHYPKDNVLVERVRKLDGSKYSRNNFASSRAPKKL